MLHVRSWGANRAARLWARGGGGRGTVERMEKKPCLTGTVESLKSDINFYFVATFTHHGTRRIATGTLDVAPTSPHPRRPAGRTATGRPPGRAPKARLDRLPVTILEVDLVQTNIDCRPPRRRPPRHRRRPRRRQPDLLHLSALSSCEAEQTPGVASHMPAKDARGSTRACAVPAHMTETVAAGAWAIHP
jgi:hypothetical protein